LQAELCDDKTQMKLKVLPFLTCLRCDHRISEVEAIDSNLKVDVKTASETPVTVASFSNLLPYTYYQLKKLNRTNH
jgi:hypothetical protein